MEVNLKQRAIKMFVFGTLRCGGRLDYYMDGSISAGTYYTEGQLMKSEIGSAYIDFNYNNVATIGEVYYINFPGLQRIDHLESTSGEFPKGYDLDLLPVWEKKEGEELSFNKEDRSWAFFYRRRNDPVKVLSGDWVLRQTPVQEIGRYLKENPGKRNSPEELIAYMQEYLQQ